MLPTAYPGRMRAVLWGRDHTELGITAVEKVDGGVALALSRGRHRKVYPYTDPNEDAVAAVVGPRATLLVLADGHNGWPATEAALQAVLDDLGDDPPADLNDDEMAELFWRAQQAVVARTQRWGSDAPESRTTLVVALIAGRRLRWGSFGDSVVYVAGSAAATRLPSPRHRFIGARDMPRRVLPDLLEHGRTALHDNQWLIVASDGFSDFAAHPFPTALLGGNVDAAVVAQGLVDAAFDGGAGDNVTVGVVAP